MRKFGMFFMAALCLARCGTHSAPATGPTSISSLPTATAAVAGGSSASAIRRFSSLESATTGTLLKDWSTTTWTGKSAPMCEIGNMTSSLLEEAGGSDRMICYTGAMQDAGLFPAALTDGNVHYYSLGGLGSGGLKLKMQVTKTGGAISTFKMWSCENSTTSNDSYDAEDLSNTSAVTLVSASSHSANGNTGAQRTVITGAINSAGQWTSKVISHNGAFASGSTFSMNQQFTLTQYPAYANFTGFFTGTFGVNTNTGQIYADYGILGASALKTFAVGNGTVSAKFSYGGGGHTDTNAQVLAWTGDDRATATASSSDYYATVSAATLPTISTVTTSMQTGETWDCQADAAGFTIIDMSSAAGQAVMNGGIAACNDKLRFSASGNSNWVDCHAGSFN